MLQDYANIDVFAQTCSNLKLPLTLKFSFEEAEIFSSDQDSSTGFLYIGGTTTATELEGSVSKKSALTALFNGLDYT